MAAGSSVVDLHAAASVAGRRPTTAHANSPMVPYPAIAQPVTALTLVSAEVCAHRFTRLRVNGALAQTLVLGELFTTPIKSAVPWRRAIVFVTTLGEVILGHTIRDLFASSVSCDTSIVLQARYDAMWSPSTFYMQHPWRLELSHREVALLRHVAQECRWDQEGVPTLIPELGR